MRAVNGEDRTALGVAVDWVRRTAIVARDAARGGLGVWTDYDGVRAVVGGHLWRHERGAAERAGLADGPAMVRRLDGARATVVALVTGEEKVGRLERSSSAWRPWMWPIKAVMIAGFFLMLLQCVSELLKDVLRLRGDWHEGAADVV